MPKGLSGYKKLGIPYIACSNKEIDDLNKLLQELDADPIEMEKEWSKYGKYPASISAYRTLRILSKELIEFHNLAQRYYSSIKFTHIITMTPNEPAKLRVFINMPLSGAMNYDDWKKAGPYSCTGPLETLIDTIHSDMSKEDRSKGWNPLSRARNRIKKYEDMTIERALTRFTNMPGKLTEKQIVEISSQIYEERKPVELIFANTPQEIAKMYSSGPSSCMATGAGNPDRGGYFRILAMANSHPCAFFAYHPYVRGVYIKKGNTVRARTFLYTMENGKEYYGRCYYIDAPSMNVFKHSLKMAGFDVLPPNHGKNPRDGSGMYFRDVEFRVPSVEYNGEHIMPYPYLDNLTGSLKFEFDMEKKEFIVRQHSFEKYARVRDYYPSFNVITAGGIPASSLSGAKCGYCQRNVDVTRTPGRYVAKNTGLRYCSDGCLDTVKLVLATDGQGNRTIVPKAAAVQDIHSGLWFTTVTALFENGGGCYANGVDVFEEDIYTNQGFLIKNHNPLTQESVPVELSIIHNGKIDDCLRALDNNMFRKDVINLKKVTCIDFDPTQPQEVVIKGEIPDIYSSVDINIDPSMGFEFAESKTKWRTKIGQDFRGNLYSVQDNESMDQELAVA